MEISFLGGIISVLFLELVLCIYSFIFLKKLKQVVLFSHYNLFQNGLNIYYIYIILCIILYYIYIFIYYKKIFSECAFQFFISCNNFPKVIKITSYWEYFIRFQHSSSTFIVFKISLMTNVWGKWKLIYVFIFGTIFLKMHIFEVAIFYWNFHWSNQPNFFCGSLNL